MLDRERPALRAGRRRRRSPRQQPLRPAARPGRGRRRARVPRRPGQQRDDRRDRPGRRRAGAVTATAPSRRRRGPSGRPLPAIGLGSTTTRARAGRRRCSAASPARVLRLPPPAPGAWTRLRAGPVTAGRRALARRLTDAGLAHPVPPAPAGTATSPWSIPVRDRAAQLDRCLAALGARYPVVVVDDGFDRPGRDRRGRRRHGARLIRRERATAARPRPATPGSPRSTTELVAFLDSDCVPPPAGSTALAGAPGRPARRRGRAAHRRGRARRRCGRPVRRRARQPRPRRPAGAGRAAAAGRLRADRGAARAPRRAARRRRDGGVFDPALRYGEDVDLVWRLTRRLAGPLRPGGPGRGTTSRAPGRRCWPAGSATAPRPRRWPGATPRARAARAQPVAGRGRRRVLARRPRSAAAACAAAVAAMRRACGGRLSTGGLPAAMRRRRSADLARRRALRHPVRRAGRCSPRSRCRAAGDAAWPRRPRCSRRPLRLVGRRRARSTRSASPPATSPTTRLRRRRLGRLPARTAPCAPLRPVASSDAIEGARPDGQRLVRDRRRGAAPGEEAAAQVGVRRAGRRLRAGPDARGQPGRVRRARASPRTSPGLPPSATWRPR